MSGLRRVETADGDGSACWLCKVQGYEVLFDAPAHGGGGNGERVSLCYKCEALRRWHALDLGEDEEDTPAAACFIKPVWTHAEAARVRRMAIDEGTRRFRTNG